MDSNEKHVNDIAKKLKRCINKYIMENPEKLCPWHISDALAQTAGEYLSALDINEREAFVKTFVRVSSELSPKVKIIKFNTETPQ